MKHVGNWWPHFSYRDDFDATKDWKAVVLWAVVLASVICGPALYLRFH